MAPRRKVRSSGKGTRSRTGAGSTRTRQPKSASRKPARPAKPKSSRRAPLRPARRPGAASRSRRPPASPPARSALGLERQHIDYTTHVMDEVRRFYTQVLELGPHEFDSRTGRFTVMTGTGSSLGFVPPMPGPPEQWRPPREPAICLVVRDVDRAYRELSGRGVSFVQEPIATPWGQRVAILRDPEGRTVMLASPAPR